jgi:WD40 repeat protein
VRDVCFSPDGQLIASASADRTIRLWSREGEEIKILNGHKDWVRDVCFSPDGQLIASASADRTIRLWSREGEEIKIAPMEHQDRVNSISFSPDGKIIVSSSDDHTIKLWDINRDLSEGISVSLRKTFFKHALDHQDGHSGSVNSAIFSPPNIRYGIEDQIIASASDDETIKLWSLDGKCLATLKGHQGIVRWATFSQNGQLLASASDDYTVKIWGIDYTLFTNSDGKTDCKINGTLLTTFKGHHDWVWDVNFSFISDSKLLASASDDNSIKLWNLDVQFPQNMQAHQEKVWAVSFSSDSQFLATASSDKTVKIWNLEEKKLLKTLDEHTDWVWTVNFSPDGKFLASGGGDKSLKIWKVGESISEISLIEDINIQNHKYTNYAHKDCICCVKFSPNSQLLASASADNTIKLWDIKGNYINTLKGHEDKVYSIYFSSDGEKIISVSADKTIKLWSCSTGEEIKTFCGHKEWVNYATFSPDDQYIASASNDNTIRIWDINGKSKIIGRHRGKVWSVRFINEKTLVSASEDKTLKLWTLKEGFWKLEKEEVGIMQPNPIKGISNKITNVKLSPNRKILAAPTNDGIIQIWNIEKLKIEPLELNSLLNKGEDWLNNYRRSRVEQPPPQ